MESDRVESCHKFYLQFIWMAYWKNYQNLLLFVIGSNFVGALCYADDWRAGVVVVRSSGIFDILLYFLYLYIYRMW